LIAFYVLLKVFKWLKLDFMDFIHLLVDQHLYMQNDIIELLILCQIAESFSGQQKELDCIGLFWKKDFVILLKIDDVAILALSPKQKIERTEKKNSTFSSQVHRLKAFYGIWEFKAEHMNSVENQFSDPYYNMTLWNLNLFLNFYMNNL